MQTERECLPVPEVELWRIAALPQPLHIYEFVTRSRHFHLGLLGKADEPVATTLDRLALNHSGLLPPGGRVLDVGCALGGTVALLAARGFESVGIDVCSRCIGFARQSFETVSSARFHAMGLSDFACIRANRGRPFDAVTMIEVTQHLPDEHGLFRTFRTLTRPGGVVSIHDFVANGDFPRSAVPFHRRGRKLSAAMLAGFEVVDHEDLTGSVLPTLRALSDSVRASTAELHRRIGPLRIALGDEIDELLANLGHLYRGLADRHLTYESLVLRRR